VEAGLNGRESGWSMWLGMNSTNKILQPGETLRLEEANATLKDGKGRGGFRTHMVSPMMAAAAAICRSTLRISRNGVGVAGRD